MRHLAHGDETWSTRRLTSMERDHLRAHLPRRYTRDGWYLARMLALCLVVAAIGTRLLRFPGPPGSERAMGVLSFLLYFAIAALLIRGHDPRRLNRALGRRARRTPTWAWVTDVVLTHTVQGDSQNERAQEVRYQAQGRVWSLPVTSEQLPYFPEGPAKVEILPGSGRQVYRFSFQSHTVEMVPEFRVIDTPMQAYESGPTETAVALLSEPGAYPRRTLRRHRRRKRRHRPWWRKMMSRRVYRNLTWLVVSVMIGGGITLLVLEYQIQYQLVSQSVGGAK